MLTMFAALQVHTRHRVYYFWNLFNFQHWVVDRLDQAELLE